MLWIQFHPWQTQSRETKIELDLLHNKIFQQLLQRNIPHKYYNIYVYSILSSSGSNTWAIEGGDESKYL